MNRSSLLDHVLGSIRSITPGLSIFTFHGNFGLAAHELARRLREAIHAPVPAEIGPAAGRIGGRVKPDDRRIDHGGHVRGSRIWSKQHRCRTQQGEHLRQRVAADLIDGFKAACDNIASPMRRSMAPGPPHRITRIFQRRAA